MSMRRKWLCLILMCLLIGVSSSPAFTAETISVSINDAREIMADNAALLAEISAVRKSLTTEREQTRKLVFDYNATLSADADMIEQYKAMNLTLTDTIEANNKAHTTELRAEKAKGWGKGALGLLIGTVIGLVSK